MNACKWCGDTVTKYATNECDRCWEIRWQCEVAPGLVAKILAALTKRAGDLLDSPACCASFVYDGTHHIHCPRAQPANR